MEIARFLGALLFIALGLLASAGVYFIASTIWNGAVSGNWLMVIAGGVLAYVFGVLLIVAAIICFVIALSIIFD